MTGMTPISYFNKLKRTATSAFQVVSGYLKNEWHNAQELLEFGIKNDNTQYVEHALDWGADPNLVVAEGVPPIFRTLNCSLELITALLEHGANANVTDKHGNTPLHLFSRHGRLEIIKALIKKGADIHLKNTDEETAIDIAFKQKFVHITFYLREQGAVIEEPSSSISPLLEPTDFFIPREELQDRLRSLWAAMSLHHDPLLMDAFNCRDYDNLLQECNRTVYSLISERFIYERNALFRKAVSDAPFEFMDLMLQKQAVQWCAGAENNEALITACRMGDLKKVNRLLEVPSVLSLVTLNENEALRTAEENHHQRIVDRLREIQAVNEYQINQLQLEFIKLLVEHDPVWPESVLSRIDELLKAGANPNIYIKPATADKVTFPLAMSIRRNHLGLFKVLMQNGADPLFPEDLLFYDREFLPKTSEELFSWFDSPVLITSFQLISDVLLEDPTNSNLKEMYGEVKSNLQQRFPEFYPTIKAKLKEFIKPFFNKIYDEDKVAKSLGRKLIILVGENHYSAYSLIINKMVAMLAANVFNVERFMLEMPEAFKKHDPFTLAYDNMGTMNIYLKEVLKKEPIFIDNGRKHHAYSDGLMVGSIIDITEEGIQYRNSIMYDETKKYKDQSVFAQLGVLHLYGMLVETSLTADFHVLAIKAGVPTTTTGFCFGPYHKLCDDFSKTVFYRPEDPHFIKWINCIEKAFSNDELLKLWQEIFQELHAERLSMERAETEDLSTSSTTLTFAFAATLNSAEVITTAHSAIAKIPLTRKRRKIQ